MTWLEESVEVPQCQLADVQSVLLAVEGEGSEYYRRLGIEEQRRAGLVALLPGLVVAWFIISL